MPVVDTTSYRSPNYNNRPQGMAIAALVIHTTEGSFDSDAEWMCNPSSGVSTHYVIAPNGAIYQLVDDAKRAWHAGETSYNGRSNWNDFSIGVEISHKQGQAYSSAQAASLTDLSLSLIGKYKITRPNVVTHRQIATPRGRKSDPTDWNDADFKVWADSLYASPGAGIYVARHTQAIFEAPRPDSKVALADTARIIEGQEVDVDEVKNGWAHMRNHTGFLPVGVLTRVR